MRIYTKKFMAASLAALACTGLLTGCGKNEEETNKTDVMVCSAVDEASDTGTKRVFELGEDGKTIEKIILIDSTNKLYSKHIADLNQISVEDAYSSLKDMMKADYDTVTQENKHLSWFYPATGYVDEKYETYVRYVVDLTDDNFDASKKEYRDFLAYFGFGEDLYNADEMRYEIKDVKSIEKSLNEGGIQLYKFKCDQIQQENDKLLSKEYIDNHN